MQREVREVALGSKILVVEDDAQMSSLLRRSLAYEGYRVEVADSGEQAMAQIRPVGPDLVILDVMLPGITGLDVCRKLRTFSDMPVLMLTARRAVSDKVAGFESGADDYLAKPFALEELTVRVKALLRRTGVHTGNCLSCADLVMDPASREVWRGDRRVELTAKEFDLLELFLHHPKQVLKRDLIFDRLWGYDFGGESNLIDVYVRYLRAKLNAQGEPDLIHTVRGVGYVLKEG